MDYKEIIKLLDAGYSREDILQMQEGTGADEGASGADTGSDAAAAAGADTGADELNAAIKDMKEMFTEFTKEITAMNIMNSQQSADKTNTAEEIIANIISPTIKNKTKNKKE